MAFPLVYLSVHRIKDGKLEEFKRYYHDNIGSIETQEPRTIAQEAWLDEDERQVTILHVFPDQESMDFHMELAMQRVGPAYEFLEPVRMEVFGRPSEKVREMLTQGAAAQGLQLGLAPHYLAGFTRNALD